VFQRLRKKIPYTSAVHMPFKNAVVYILLYGTAECYYFQKNPRQRLYRSYYMYIYGTRHITKRPNIGLMRDLNDFFFQELFDLQCSIPAVNNITILCLMNEFTGKITNTE